MNKQPAPGKPELDDLPPVFQGEIDREQLAQLFVDLTRCATVHHVQIQRSDSASTDPGSADQQLTLEDARQLLFAGNAQRVQIRYTYQQQHWCDTIIAGRTGARVVRIQQDHDPTE